MKNYAFIAFFCLFYGNSDSACPEYNYQDTATSCAQCSAVSGYRLRCLAWNRSVCESCPMGKYSVLNGTINTCIACPKGTFSNVTGSGACKPCPELSYAEVPGSTECTPCQKCTTVGKYRSGCNATSSGTCSQCTKRI